MKKMNKMYEAPKAEVVELNVNYAIMVSGTAIEDPTGGDDPFA